MAIHEQQVSIVEGGLQKSLDEGSVRMLLDSFQRDQYSYPEKSTVRELASNAIDATRERDLARRILSGQTKVEDHYVNREGPEYKDSHFDPLYYDLNWLSTDPNIHITYKEGSALEKDKLIIRDKGIGLGGKRLLGYFSLGYSTKRLSNFGLGKFGMGAKAALSTGISYYVVKNRYNGIETWWNVYPYQAEPCIPKFNTQTGEENPLLDLGPIKAHYYHTLEPNGLEVVMEVKKHNKQKYIDAIKSQLLYFDHIVFEVESADGRLETININAPILYEDDIMILSKNDFYTKPHILVNRVNYGLIDFQELELEDKIGNISIKLKPEEVSVSPNRERVIWNEMTAAAIKNRFKEVQVAAEKLLQGELEQTDFMKWMKACIMLRNKLSTEQSGSLVARLAKIVDLKSYTPTYKPDPQFRLDWSLFAGMKVRKITGKTEREGSQYKFKVDRSNAGFSDLVDDDMPVLIQQGDTNALRDRYLLEDVYQDGFVTIWLNETEITRPKVDESMTEEEADKAYLRRKDMMIRHTLDAAHDLHWHKRPSGEETPPSGMVEQIMEKVLDRWRKLNQFILSSEGVQFYDTIEIPESYKSQLKEEESGDGTIKQESEVQTEEARVSAEARRKLQGKTILFTPRLCDDRDQLYEWHKLEIPVTDIDQWNNPEIFYSSDDNASLLQLAAFITRPADKKARYSDEIEFDNIHWSTEPQDVSALTAYNGNTAVKLIKVAQNRVRYYQDFKHIHQFFAQVNKKTKTLTMSNALIRWNTARYIHNHLEDLKFLNNFDQFHQEHAQTYKSLVSYCKKYYREVGQYTDKYKEIQSVEYNDMINHLDKVAELQIFVREYPNDAEAISTMVKELFGTDLVNVVTDGCAIDIHMRDLVHTLLDYAEPIKVMLNHMPILTSLNGGIEEELETEIRNFIRFKQGS